MSSGLFQFKKKTQWPMVDEIFRRKFNMAFFYIVIRTFSMYTLLVSSHWTISSLWKARWIVLFFTMLHKLIMLCLIFIRHSNCYIHTTGLSYFHMESICIYFDYINCTRSLILHIDQLCKDNLCFSLLYLVTVYILSQV